MVTTGVPAAPLVAYNVTAVPLTTPARPRAVVRGTLPFCVHVPPARDHFWIWLLPSSATYSVSTPVPPSRWAKKKLLMVGVTGKPGRVVVVCPAVVGVPEPMVPRRKTV